MVTDGWKKPEHEQEMQNNMDRMWIGRKMNKNIEQENGTREERKEEGTLTFGKFDVISMKYTSRIMRS